MPSLSQLILDTQGEGVPVGLSKHTTLHLDDGACFALAGRPRAATHASWTSFLGDAIMANDSRTASSARLSAGTTLTEPISIEGVVAGFGPCRPLMSNVHTGFFFGWGGTEAHHDSGDHPAAGADKSGTVTVEVEPSSGSKGSKTGEAVKSKEALVHGDRSADREAQDSEDTGSRAHDGEQARSGHDEHSTENEPTSGSNGNKTDRLSPSKHVPVAVDKAGKQDIQEAEDKQERDGHAALSSETNGKPIGKHRATVKNTQSEDNSKDAHTKDAAVQKGGEKQGAKDASDSSGNRLAQHENDSEARDAAKTQVVQASSSEDHDDEETTPVPKTVQVDGKEVTTTVNEKTTVDKSDVTDPIPLTHTADVKEESK